jgi:putative MATE family efflux protein
MGRLCIMDNEQTALEPPPTTTAIIHRPLATWRLVLHLAWPVLAQQFLILVVSLSDRYLAGREEHVAYQAAQTTTFYLSWVISSFTVLVSVGSTALVARFVGAGDHRSAIHATNQSILLAFVLGLGGTIVGLAGIDGLLWLLQLRGEAAVDAAAYLWPLFLVVIFQVIESAGLACLVGAGDTRMSLYVLGGVAILNVPLAWSLSMGLGPIPAQGFVGIARGTALSTTIGGLAVLAVLIRGRAGLRLRLRWLWPDAELIRRLLRVSVPAGVDSLSVAAAQLWFLSIVNRLPYAESSAHGIALGWEALGFLSGAAFGTAAMTLVGQNLGAGRPKQAAKSGWTAFGLGCGFMSLMGVVFFAFAPQMFAVFCPGEQQQEVIVKGVPVLKLVAFAMPGLASAIIFTNALRGAGDTRVPVLFTFIGFLIVRIPLAHYLALEEIDLGPLGVWHGVGMGLYGAWLAMCADVVLRGGLFLARFASGQWKWVRV